MDENADIEFLMQLLCDESVVVTRFLIHVNNYNIPFVPRNDNKILTELMEFYKKINLP